MYRRSYGMEAQDWMRVPDDFWMRLGPYGKFFDAGSDIQGGNTPFELYMDSTNNSKVDKSMLLMGTPYRGSGAAEKNKGFKSIKGGQLVNGLGIGKNDMEWFWGMSGSKEAKPAVNYNIVENNIFNNYSKPKDFKEFDKGDKLMETKSVSGIKKSKNEYTMGRIEARKYLTLDWDRQLDYQDPETNFLLSDMFYSEQERFYGRREIDTRLLYFDYYWIDYKEAARRGKIVTQSVDSRRSYAYDSLMPDADPLNPNLYSRSRRDPLSKDYKKNDLHRTTLDPTNTDRVWIDSTVYTDQVVDKDGNFLLGQQKKDPNNWYATVLENPGQDLDMGFTNSKGGHNAIRGHTDRSRFIIKERINVYPDTLCWVRDFTYAFHSPMTKNYFWHTAYDNYPVVGITWTQAKAFSVWRTQIYHSWLHANGDLFVNDFRLPTESEWERAARGDLDQSQFPWGGPYVRNAKGCFLANFKPMRGRYFEDGGFHTVKVYSYNPNGFGLYCMAGNVAEWCSTAFDESQYEFGHDMNSDFDYEAKDGDHPVKKRKVIRGGSWKDIGYYLNNSTRTFEYQDTAKSYIGFRNVMTHLGRGGKELDLENGEEIQSDIQLK
jgi:formylglycine-generating enzyme required for sulfatase activity